MSRVQPILIRVLIARHGDQWHAQGLDFALSAQAPSEKQAIRSFLRIVRARLKLDRERGRKPLEGLPPAPERYFEVWDRLEREGHEDLPAELASDPAADTPPAYVIKQIVQADNGPTLER